MNNIIAKELANFISKRRVYGGDKMEKGIIGVVTVIIVVAVVMAIGVNVSNNELCYEIEHRGIYPVNPYCERCGRRSGFIQHKCTNPNGKEKYCRVCGKIMSEK